MQQGPFSRTRSRACRSPDGHSWCRVISSCLAQTRCCRAFAFAYARWTTSCELRHRSGGVGPHFDSYDVFLLQGRATPVSVGKQREPELDPKGARSGFFALPRREGMACSNRETCSTMPPGWRTTALRWSPAHLFDRLSAPSDQEVAREFLAFLRTASRSTVPIGIGESAQRVCGGRCAKTGSTGSA